MNQEETGLESLLAFSKAIDSREIITAKDSILNIRDNMIVITYLSDIEADLHHNIIYTENKFSGLLLTKDGYFITTNHCVQKVIPKWEKFRYNLKRYLNKEEFKKILNQEMYVKNIWKKEPPILKYGIIKDKDVYPIDITFWTQDKENDLILLKADIPRKAQPILYKISKRGLTLNESVNLIGPKGCRHILGKITGISNYKVITEYGTLKDVFDTDLKIDYKNISKEEVGLSGRVFINVQGELIGMCSCTPELDEYNEMFISGIKANKILKLILKE